MNNTYVKLVESILLERKKKEEDEDGKSKPTVHHKKEVKEIKLISLKEMERLAKISAKYDTKKALANKFFKQEYTSLNPKQKKRIRDEMKKPIIKKKIETLIDSKVKERSDKQQQEIEKQKKRKDKQIAKSKKEKE
jgi:hypothetical protein